MSSGSSDRKAIDFARYMHTRMDSLPVSRIGGDIPEDVFVQGVIASTCSCIKRTCGQHGRGTNTIFILQSVPGRPHHQGGQGERPETRSTDHRPPCRRPVQLFPPGGARLLLNMLTPELLAPASTSVHISCVCCGCALCFHTATDAPVHLLQTKLSQ